MGRRPCSHCPQLTPPRGSEEGGALDGVSRWSRRACWAAAGFLGVPAAGPGWRAGPPVRPSCARVCSEELFLCFTAVFSALCGGHSRMAEAGGSPLSSECRGAWGSVNPRVPGPALPDSHEESISCELGHFREFLLDGLREEQRKSPFNVGLLVTEMLLASLEPLAKGERGTVENVLEGTRAETVPVWWEVLCPQRCPV